MTKYPLQRNYLVGWYTLRSEDAINGLKKSLSKRKGVNIVGITPSISRIQNCGLSSSEMMEYSIRSYLDEHLSIKNFIVINKEDIKEFYPNVFIGEDIPFGADEKLIDMLNSPKNPKKKVEHSSNNIILMFKRIN